MSAPVIIDLDVNTTATGTINVFSQAASTITNKVIASVKVPVAVFFVGNESALFEFQGQDDDIVGRLESIWTTAPSGFQLRKDSMSLRLHNSLTGSLNASDASPFNLAVGGVPRYTNAGHKTYGSFGHLALGSYAHFLFGHVDATAAIDNDVAFINKINGRIEASGEANLATKLVNTIFELPAAQVTAIVKQVIGQDASRATGVDNDNTLPDGFQRLAFRAGDKFYVSVTLNAPTVSVLDAAAQQSEPASSLFATPIKYMVEMELANI